MKVNKFLSFLIALTAVSILLTLACSRNNGQDLKKPVPQATATQNTDQPGVAVRNSTPSVAALDVLRKFAESYEPRSSKTETIPSTPEPDEKLSTALDELSQTQSREHEKYIVLIILKLDRFQTEHFKQSYEIGNNRLAREFYRLTGDNYKPGDEPRFAHLAKNWVEKHSKLLEYKPIADEMKRLEKAEEKIEAELNKTIKPSK